jgi:hypothetical protein
MDLTPGEKAVLAQIRVLYKEAGRDQQTKALTMQWPQTHYETYAAGYAGLVEKQLLQGLDAQRFRITDRGLSALGIPVPAPVPQLQAARREKGPVVLEVYRDLSPKPRRTVLSRLKGLFG